MSTRKFLLLHDTLESLQQFYLVLFDVDNFVVYVVYIVSLYYVLYCVWFDIKNWLCILGSILLSFIYTMSSYILICIVCSQWLCVLSRFLLCIINMNDVFAYSLAYVLYTFEWSISCILIWTISLYIRFLYCVVWYEQCRAY